MAALAWSFRLLLLFALATNLLGLPTPESADTESPSSKEASGSSVDAAKDKDATLSTDLQPPSIGAPQTFDKDRKYDKIVFVINTFGVRNFTGETDEEMFHSSVIQKAPQIIEPLSTVLVVFNGEDMESEESPVNLDEVAKELESQGYKVEKLGKEGETDVILLKTDPEKVDEIIGGMSTEKADEANRVRRKRTICLKCKKGGGFSGGGYGGGGYGGGGYGGGGYGGGGYGGGCPGGCGGGGTQTIGVVPLVVVPVAVTGGGGGNRGGGYHRQPSYYPSGGGGGCNTCSGGGGGGGAYAQASASAQASAWGK